MIFISVAIPRMDLIPCCTPPRLIGNWLMKRLIDILVAGACLIIFFIPMAVIGVLVAATSRGGVFYISRRVGKNGQTFDLYKFRTMTQGADSYGTVAVKLNDGRITPLGRFLRRSKLDELPQLFSVLRGEISLVGPRPDLQMYIDMYSPEERGRILSVKPGLSDWASLVNYHQHDYLLNADDIDEAFLKYIRPVKVALQLYYVNNSNMLEDLKILGYTAFKFIGVSLPLPEKVIQISKFSYTAQQ